MCFLSVLLHSASLAFFTAALFLQASVRHAHALAVFLLTSGQVFPLVRR